MRFMNRWEIDAVAEMLEGADLVNATKAAHSLVALRDWTDANSDGWPYWPKPCRAAARLIEALEDLRATYRRRDLDDGDDLTPSQLGQATRAVRSFLTRQGCTFDHTDGEISNIGPIGSAKARSPYATA